MGGSSASLLEFFKQGLKCNLGANAGKRFKD
jgi:hypothetical protein